MKVRSLNIGVESITHWEMDHEVHLPSDGALGPAFLPVYRPLDEILRRPTLDERLPALLRPDLLDSDLLAPAAMTDARMETAGMFNRVARRQHGRRKEVLQAAASLLEEDVGLDDEVRRALAMLLRG